MFKDSKRVRWEPTEINAQYDALEDAITSLECAQADLEGMEEFFDEWNAINDLIFDMTQRLEEIEKECAEEEERNNESILRDRLRA